MFTDEILNELSATEYDTNSLLQFQKYSNLIQEKCREKWSTFNVDYCVIGLVLLALSIINLFIFLIRLYNDNELTDINIEFFSINLIKIVASCLILYCCLIYWFEFNLKLPVSFVLFNLYFLIKFKSTMKFVKISADMFKKEYILYAFIFVMPFSNSFVIHEKLGLKFILITLLLVEFISRLKLIRFDKKFILKKLFELICICTCLGMTQIFYVCREETLILNCTQGVFATQLTKLNFDHSISANEILWNKQFQTYSAFILFNFITICLIILFIIKTNLKNSNLVLNTLIGMQLLTLLIYWFLQLVINIYRDKANHLSDLNFYLARLFYSIFVISQILIWCRTESAIEQAALGTFYLNTIVYLSISVGLLATILTAEASLSVWLLILVLILYSKYRSTWPNNSNLNLNQSKS